MGFEPTGRGTPVTRFAALTLATAVGLTIASAAPASHAATEQTALNATSAGQAAEGQSSAAAPTGLADLATMTFGCPQAGLNAAARAAAQVPTQGTYQFSYFRLINDAHHATYEVHFKSNFYGEPELHYCVAMYCQQGWDPKAAQPTVTLMSPGPRRGKGGHESMCGAPAQKGRSRTR